MFDLGHPENAIGIHMTSPLMA